MKEIGNEIAKQVFYKLIIPVGILFAIGVALGAWLF
mgnify:CR=1 FL=1|tara:strand:- start:55 stop:162 length:108 start_codon:yes stop_codon:yes gene_type:complete